MIVSVGEGAEIPVKAVSAQIIPPGGAYTVTPPVTHGLYDLEKQRIVGIHTAPLAHSHVMGGIEGGCAYIAPCAGVAGLSVYGVGGPQGIAVILDEPQAVPVAEFLYCRNVKGIAQCMRRHDRLCFLRQCPLQQGYIHIVSGNGHVDEHRHCPVLYYRIYGGGEAPCNGYDLVPPLYAPLPQQGRGKGHECD